MHQIILLFRGFFDFFLVLYRRRALIYEMAKRDILSNHVGSMLGFFWTFINPLVMIFVLWFVFTFGFRSALHGSVPFVVWLTAGMAVWNTFSEAVSGSTGVIVGNAHLVKKSGFPFEHPVGSETGCLFHHTQRICASAYNPYRALRYACQPLLVSGPLLFYCDEHSYSRHRLDCLFRQHLCPGHRSDCRCYAPVRFLGHPGLLGP